MRRKGYVVLVQIWVLFVQILGTAIACAFVLCIRAHMFLEGVACNQAAVPL